MCRVGVLRHVVGVLRCVVGVLTAVTSSGGADTSNTDTQSKSFYGNSTPQPTRPPVNNVRVYNGGAPVGFVDTPTNIHPIASLTPYQNRFLYLLNPHLLALLSVVYLHCTNQAYYYIDMALPHQLLVSCGHWQIINDVAVVSSKLSLSSSLLCSICNLSTDTCQPCSTMSAFTYSLIGKASLCADLHDIIYLDLFRDDLPGSAFSASGS